MDIRIDATVSARSRSATFCRDFGLELPVLQAPMAGACPSGLTIAVANAGGMGGMDALLNTPDEIMAWAAGLAKVLRWPARSPQVISFVEYGHKPMPFCPDGTYVNSVMVGQ